MVRQLALRRSGALALGAAFALGFGLALAGAGCSPQENTSGAQMSPAELQRKRAEIVKDDGVKGPASSATDAPVPGAPGAPGAGPR